LLDQSDTIGHMATQNFLPPPKGYSSWLEYAVETFDTRGLWVEGLFVDQPPPDRDAMREAARGELRQLRAAQTNRAPTAPGTLE
jgi:hypothetical protein